MEEILFRTLQEANAFIAELVGNDEPVPQWAKDQRKRLKEIEANGGVIDSGTPIWDTLRALDKFPLTEEKRRCVEDSVAKLMETGPQAEEPGLLLGKIQCGKTDTFEKIIGLAFDQGMEIAIVLTKGTTALVNQTLKRLQKDFAPFRYTGVVTNKPIIEPVDIMGDVRGGIDSANANKVKYIIVCKKQTDNLKALTKLFEVYSPHLKQKKVLIVDDEADFASRNYQRVKNNPMLDEDGNMIVQPVDMKMAKIAQQIDDFRKVPSYCRYLQVTATPYCLFLQPKGELFLSGNKVMAFKPRFVSLVPAHDAYIGGDQYFVESENPDSMYSYLFHPITDKCLDIMGKEDKRYINNSIASQNIYGLTYALVSYFMATAIRVIQERPNGVDYRSSAVVHVKIDQDNHAWQNRLIDRLVNDIRKCIVDNDQTDYRIWTAIDACYEDFKESNEKGKNGGLIDINLPRKEDVIEELGKIFESKDYKIKVVNATEQVPLNDDGELRLTNTANIFIGGNILDRGITIQHMLCFFYGRNPGNFQQDTVLQHARFYGARSKADMAVTRLHTSHVIYSILKTMNELDNQLRKWLESGRYEQEDYPTFVGFSKNIKPCAPQKIQASNALTVRPQKRILPVGIWTGPKSKVSKIVNQIDELITSSKGFESWDEDGFFEIDKQLVLQIIDLIAQTYVYDEKHENVRQKSDLKEMLCALEYCTAKSENKLLWALYRTNRNVSRIRENGYWVDAPDDGRTDTAPARRKATDRPVIMFIKENGGTTDSNGERWMNSAGDYIGWNGTPFFWPVLVVQSELPPVMYAIEPDRGRWNTSIPSDKFIEGFNSDDVLRIRVSDHLEETYGPVGTVYGGDNSRTLTRDLKDTTAKKYICTDIFAGGELIEKKGADIANGVYSFNNGVFPYELKPFKYVLLEKTDNSGTAMMLIKLANPNEWTTTPIQDFNDDGDLLGIDKSVLIHARDILVDRNLEESEIQLQNICQWCISYKLEKVVKYQKMGLSWEDPTNIEESQTE